MPEPRSGRGGPSDCRHDVMTSATVFPRPARSPETGPQGRSGDRHKGHNSAAKAAVLAVAAVCTAVQLPVAAFGQTSFAQTTLAPTATQPAAGASGADTGAAPADPAQMMVPQSAWAADVAADVSANIETESMRVKGSAAAAAAPQPQESTAAQPRATESSIRHGTAGSGPLPEAFPALAAGPQVTIGAGSQGAGMPAVFATFANGVTLQPNVPYWAPSGFRALTMDIYSPPPAVQKPDAGYPMLMFIHGGGWATGDAQTSSPIADFPQLLAAISAQGYVVASVNYRLSGEAKWPAQGQDIKAAIRFLRSSATDYGVDPERFATWGISAGAQLSAIAATTCGVEELQPESQILPNLPVLGIPEPDRHGALRSNNSDCVQAAVAWSGVYDMSTLTDQARLAGAMSRELGTAPEWRLLGCISGACPQDKLASASAVQRLSHDAPPILLMTGNADKIMPYTQTLEFAGALEVEKIPHELVIITGAGHNFIGRNAAETRRATQTALDHMLSFLGQHLAPKPQG